MPTNDFDKNIQNELNLWAARVFERIKQKFIDMNINRSMNRGDGFTGDLYRSLHWEVHTAAGGSKILVQFFYLKYGDFVQWGVGRQFGDKDGQKNWPIPPLYGKDAAGIPNPEKPKYVAKPFLRREVRYRVNGLLRDLAVKYAYFADALIIKGLSDGTGDPSIMNKWISENKELLSNDFLKMVGMKR